MKHIERLNASLQLSAPYYTGSCSVDLEVLFAQDGVDRVYIDLADNDLLWAFLGHACDEHAVYRLCVYGDSVRIPLRLHDLDISLGRLRVDTYDEVPAMVAAALEQREIERAVDEGEVFACAEYDRDLSEHV